MMECKTLLCGGNCHCNKDQGHEGLHYCHTCKGERKASK